MVRIRRYHRKQTTPEMAGIYFFDCVDCGEVAEVFATERESHSGGNKYLDSGLCPRCFEVAVDAKRRMQAAHSGEIVKAAMKDKGMSQSELARRIGRDQGLISRYLSGHIQISEEAARSIAEVLGIDFDELRRRLLRDKYNRRVELLEARFHEILDVEDAGGRG